MTEIKMPSKEDIIKLIGRKVVKVRYYPDFVFFLELHFDDGTILKVVFGIDCGFVELKNREVITRTRTKKEDSSNT